jgi:hypothetical protein
MFRQFKHKVKIIKHPRGTIGKCEEELAELKDADVQGNKLHVIIEAADLINSTYTFVWRNYKVPFFVVIFAALMTGIYKPCVRWWKKNVWKIDTSKST